MSAAERPMRERGSGKMLNLIAGPRLPGGRVSASLAAVAEAAINLSQAWALRMAPHGVNVNAVLVQLAAAASVARPWLDGPAPEDVGRVVAFLVSRRAQ